MRAALGLARRGLGRTWPNPAVGCVVVREGRVVGRGWTQPGGRPHAETEALRQAGAGPTERLGLGMGPAAWLGPAAAYDAPFADQHAADRGIGPAPPQASAR